MASLEPKKFESAPPGGPAIQSFSDVAKTKEAIQQEVSDFCGRDVFTQMDKTNISAIVDKIQVLMVDKQNYQDLAPLLSSLKSLATGIASAQESAGADGSVKALDLRDRIEGVKKSSLGLITRPVGDKEKDKFSDLEFVSDLPALKATITALGDIFSSIFLKTDITQEDVNKLSNFTQTAEKLSIDPTYKILIPLVAQLKQTHRALTEVLAKESSAGGKGTANINEPSLKKEIDGIREQFIKIHTLLSESDVLTPT